MGKEQVCDAARGLIRGFLEARPRTEIAAFLVFLRNVSEHRGGFPIPAECRQRRPICMVSDALSTIPEPWVSSTRRDRIDRRRALWSETLHPTAALPRKMENNVELCGPVQRLALHFFFAFSQRNGAFKTPYLLFSHFIYRHSQLSCSIVCIRRGMLIHEAKLTT